jgi:hypothetical protein
MCLSPFTFPKTIEVPCMLVERERVSIDNVLTVISMFCNFF